MGISRFALARDVVIANNATPGLRAIVYGITIVRQEARCKWLESGAKKKTGALDTERLHLPPSVQTDSA
ncbi:MAG: hypothetical protein CMQ14_13435 [Gammaproteobacteria bacterium]|nr:hypothetical protein [Gammaproteobacteria bacterium]